jgi:ABC-2 type transport system permease protein
MSAIPAVVAKELRVYVVSPIVYVASATFLFIFGVLSYMYLQAASIRAIQMMQLQGTAAQINLNDLVFRPTFYSTAIILLLILPILTMRLFAEERKLHTFELLMTSPVALSEIVIGKYVSVSLLYLGLLALTGIVPLVLSLYSSFNWDPILTGYLGLALLGALFLAIGLFASAMTENQIVAAFLSFGMLITIWLLGALGTILGDTTLGNVISYLSFIEHFDRLVRGLIDTKDLIYYGSGLILMLFLAHGVVDSRRWK